MIDLSKTIEPKSDQLNADDLIAGSKTIKITKITITSGDQSTSIFFEGDNGKPYKPCKSMRRALVQCWGSDGSKYIGRSMTLFLDKNVTWAGQAVGGIRISHLSDIEREIILLLTSSKGKRNPFKIKPLMIKSDGKEEKAVAWVESNREAIMKCKSLEDIEQFKFVNEKFIAGVDKYDSAKNLLNDIITDSLSEMEAE